MQSVQLLEALRNQINELGGNDLVLGLCTTSPAGGKAMNYFSFPRLHPTGFAYIHLVLQDTAAAFQIIDEGDISGAFYFVDIENKNSNFSAQDIINKIGPGSYHPIEPNALTVDALMLRVFESRLDLRILIVGSGMIARALCARLETCNANYRWTAKEGRIGTARMDGMFAHRRANKRTTGSFDVVVNCIPVSGVVDFNLWVKPDTIFIEASGASLPELISLTCRKIRLDVSVEQINYVVNRRQLIEHSPVFGRGKFKGYHVCSGGYFGDLGDVVVDDFRKPLFVIGIADGMGGFSERHAVHFDEFLSLMGK